MTNEVKKTRPEFRNVGFGQILTDYKLPLPGKVSILHRVSGVGLFLSLWALLWLFDLSLTSEISFATFSNVVGYPIVKLLLLGLIWAYLHHFCAGIRFLLLDMHIGVDKPSARKSAGVVLAVSLPLAALVGLKLFGVF
ncbi:succinate dehydrogenase, cytochrome b556 subunit [Parvibium lacunae]|uniref:Succinate dehydrogenase cytochrome b556 subunit n=1 Tax=Parvibium lacunae TaxID=1888893 RepID=A0A368L6M1_9BURK|nr:succinate dehydrogenase, cytochrome b556 subunit [Parvibium lacunae]RCS59277.1 succinate dehydrogenase, cytochrome b556 subunit [Parvibium lacunae]